MAARPDLVIAAVPYQEKAVVEILKAGVRFLGLAPKTLADIYTDIATIARSASAPVSAGTGCDCRHAAGDRDRSQPRRSAKRKEASSRFLRRVGQAADCVAELGGRVGRGGGRRVSGRARGHNARRNRFWPMIPMSWWPPGAAPATASRWRRLSATGTGKQMQAVREGRVYCIQRRTPEYSRADPGRGLAGVGGGDSSRFFSTTRRAKMYYRSASLSPRVLGRVIQGTLCLLVRHSQKSRKKSTA